MAVELFEWLGRSMVKAALRLCMSDDMVENIERKHVQRKHMRDSGAHARQPAHLICYLDGVSDELVKRQLEFRRSRKLERSSTSISSSLDVVSEDSVLHGDSLGPATLRREKSAPQLRVIDTFAWGQHSKHRVLLRSRRTDCSWLDAGAVLPQSQER